ncbi:nuclear transport factor 2 family protein [Arenibaculum sp.]|uniref:nuclear transport factor 2 family protein n=1 Tax=Arenibaculum sp. TaxID=2865862 RepID=UPI002E14CCC7|nr:nuclear transport factor 2 family protein [Arenibaculum sp.]
MTVSASSEDTLSIVQQGFQAVAAKDVDGVIALLADDVEWVSPDPTGRLSWGGAWRGRDEVARWMRLVADALDDFSLVPRQFIVEEDTVVVLGRERARVAATGRPYETDFAHVVRVKGGRIVSFRGFHDTAAVLAAAA